MDLLRQPPLSFLCVSYLSIHFLPSLLSRCEDFVAPVAAAATASTASREKEEKEKDDDDEDKKFHVITCLSVVKHIHLQVGR